MKTRLLFLCWLLVGAVSAADLPTVTVEHLYYLQARAERVKKFKQDEMVNYCIAQKIGGAAFESLYAELFAMRLTLMKMQKLDERPVTDPQVVALTRKYEVYKEILREEAGRVQDGILHEGQVASDALSAIGRAQQQQ